MESISQGLRDPMWWFTAIVVGVLINLFSSYFREWLDRFRARFSERMRLMQQHEATLRAAKIQRMANNPDALSDARHREIRMRLRGCAYLGVSTAFIAVMVWARPMEGPGLWLGAITSVISFSGALHHLEEAMFMARKVEEAVQLRDRQFGKG